MAQRTSRPPVFFYRMHRLRMTTWSGFSGRWVINRRARAARFYGVTALPVAITPLTRKRCRVTHSNAQLAAAAVHALGADEKKIACLACGTSIADQLMPGHASMVQGELGLPACDVVSTSGVCLAGITALKYAVNAVRTGECDYAVATGSELSSASMKAGNFLPEIDSAVDALDKQPELAFEKDFLRWMLSDGAGAVLLESAPRTSGMSLRVDWIDILSYAGDMETCMYAGAVKQASGALQGWQQRSAVQRDSESAMAVKQDVKLLNDNIIRYTVEQPLQTLIKKRGLVAETFQYFLPHYSSLFFRDKVYAGMQRAGLDIPPSRWFTNLASKGNTGSASIYIMLDELFRSGTLQAGEKLLCYIPESGRFATGFMQLTVV